MKPKVALVRGKFLNKYELQFYEPLVSKYEILGIGSLSAFHKKFAFPVVLLPSPVDLPEFPFKMQILNRLFIDANLLLGLEKRLQGYDIVHTAETYYHYTYQAAILKKRRQIKKLVVSVFENIPFAAEGIWGRKYFKKLTRSQADHFIAVSHKTKEALLTEGVKPDRITVITQHIDTNRFKPLKKKSTANSCRILFCGRLERYKGIYDFIAAAQLVLNNPSLKKYRITFSVVGKGSEYANLLRLEKELGIAPKVSHKYYTYDQMPHVYQQADLFVAPSTSTPHWQEQFSTVLLEAKASGLPIIATSSGGIPENVRHAGILVSENSPAAIARAISRFLNNSSLMQKYSQLAREDALQNFSLKVGAAKVAKVYEKVISE